MPNYFKKALENLKKNSSMPFVKGAGMVALGALSYFVVPTAIEALSMKKDEQGDNLIRIDMTGWKGVLVGAGTTIIAGMAVNSPEFALGGVAAATAHISVARFNDWIIYPVFGKHLFRFDPKALNDDMSSSTPGARQIDVGGKQVTVLDRSAVTATPISGYQQVGLLPEASLGGYTQDLTPQATPQLSGAAQGLTKQATPQLNGAAQGLMPQATPNLSGYTQGLTSQPKTGMADQMSQFRRRMR